VHLLHHSARVVVRVLTTFQPTTSFFYYLFIVLFEFGFFEQSLPFESCCCSVMLRSFWLFQIVFSSFLTIHAPTAKILIDHPVCFQFHHQCITCLPENGIGLAG
jgi:hypothetical protein